MEAEPTLLRVRGGELAGTGSWLYVWLRCGERHRPVVYVGVTGLPPVVRTWLHLHDADPDVGRLAARYPDLAREDLDVLVFALPDDLRRPVVKAAVVRGLAAAGMLAATYVGDLPQPDPPAATAALAGLAGGITAAVVGAAAAPPGDGPGPDHAVE